TGRSPGCFGSTRSSPTTCARVGCTRKATSGRSSRRCGSDTSPPNSLPPPPEEVFIRASVQTSMEWAQVVFFHPCGGGALHAQKNARNTDGMGVCTLARSKGRLRGGGREEEQTMTTKSKPLRRGWSGSIEQRSDPKGRQVKCLTSDEGHVWMPNYDKLPPVV